MTRMMPRTRFEATVAPSLQATSPRIRSTTHSCCLSQTLRTMRLSALRMMANWDLMPLQRALPLLKPRLVLVVASNDRSIPPIVANRVHAQVPGSLIERMPGLGHLAHEEAPEAAAAIILRHAN